MEMKYVVPDMAQSFGTLEFAGESEPVFERDKNNRRVLARRSYNLYSDVQKGENVVVEIPVQAGEKKFKYEQRVKLVNPKLYGRGYAIGDMGHTDYVLVADDIVAVEETLEDQRQALLLLTAYFSLRDSLKMAVLFHLETYERS